MLIHEEMIGKMLENPEVKAEYEALEPEFELLDESSKGPATSANCRYGIEPQLPQGSDDICPHCAS